MHVGKHEVNKLLRRFTYRWENC